MLGPSSGITKVVKDDFSVGILLLFG